MNFDRLFRAASIAGVAVLLTTPAAAQWLNYPTPGTPRLPDGKPNLAAPAPRTPDGKPDLAGVWRGAGPIYRFNIAQDLKTEDIQPWAEALFLKRVRDSRKDSPLARCLPVSVPFHNFFNLTRIVQTPALIVMLYESPNGPHRTVFTDGRDLPKAQSTWLGYSIRAMGRRHARDYHGGVQRQGLAGQRRTSTNRIAVFTERLRRRDFGHMDFGSPSTIQAFTRPFTIKTERLLAADTDLLEDICENESDGRHLSGDTGIRLSPALLATYAGAYELAPGRDIVVTVTGDLLFVQGLNEPRLPLLVQSETTFMSTATPTGFEFIKDAQGTVTHLLVRGDAGERKAVRRR